MVDYFSISHDLKISDDVYKYGYGDVCGYCGHFSNNMYSLYKNIQNLCMLNPQSIAKEPTNVACRQYKDVKSENMREEVVERSTMKFVRKEIARRKKAEERVSFLNRKIRELRKLNKEL